MDQQNQGAHRSNNKTRESHQPERPSNPRQIVYAASGGVFALGVFSVVFLLMRLVQGLAGVEGGIFEYTRLFTLGDVAILGLAAGPAMAAGSRLALYTVRLILLLTACAAFLRMRSLFSDGLSMSLEVFGPEILVQATFFSILLIFAGGLLACLWHPRVVSAVLGKPSVGH